MDELHKQNEDAWNKSLQGVNFHGIQGAQIVNRALSSGKANESEEEKNESNEELNENKHKTDNFISVISDNVSFII